MESRVNECYVISSLPQANAGISFGQFLRGDENYAEKKLKKKFKDAPAQSSGVQ